MWSPDPAIIVTAAQKAAEAQAATVERFRSAIQTHVDATAKSRNYDGGNALASYVASTNPQWAAKAQAFVAWRDAVWLYAYAELDKVMAGQREQPTVEAFVNELPAIVSGSESSGRRRARGVSWLGVDRAGTFGRNVDPQYSYKDLTNDCCVMIRSAPTALNP